MKVKLILCNFEGTIKQADVLDKLCAVAGREADIEIADLTEVIAYLEEE